MENTAIGLLQIIVSGVFVVLLEGLKLRLRAALWFTIVNAIGLLSSGMLGIKFKEAVFVKFTCFR